MTFFLNQVKRITKKPGKKNNEKYPETIEEMEKQMIISTLEKCDGNYSTAAIKLGITRQTLYNKTKKHGI